MKEETDARYFISPVNIGAAGFEPTTSATRTQRSYFVNSGFLVVFR